MKDNPGYRAHTRILTTTRHMRVYPVNNVSMFVEGREHPDPNIPQETITLEGMAKLLYRITGFGFGWGTEMGDDGQYYYRFFI